MGLLENKHVKERELFCRLLTNTDKNATLQEQAAMFTPQERNAKIAELRDARSKSIKGCVNNDYFLSNCFTFHNILICIHFV